MKITRPHHIRHRLKTAAAREALKRSGVIPDRTIIALQYPPNHRNVPRYITPHPKLGQLVAAGEDRYRKTLSTLLEYAEDSSRIAVRDGEGPEPSWIKGFFP